MLEIGYAGDGGACSEDVPEEELANGLHTGLHLTGNRGLVTCDECLRSCVSAGRPVVGC